MMGEKDSTGQFNGTIPELCRSVGLTLKTLVASGSSDSEAIKKLSGSVLGYKWNIERDVLGVRFSFNESKKRKGIRTG